MTIRVEQINVDPVEWLVEFTPQASIDAGTDEGIERAYFSGNNADVRAKNFATQHYGWSG